MGVDLDPKPQGILLRKRPDPIGAKPSMPMNGDSVVDPYGLFLEAEQARQSEASDPRVAVVEARSKERIARVRKALQGRELTVGEAHLVRSEEQVNRARDRFTLGLPVADVWARQFRYEGVTGRGIQRMDAYAESSSRQLEKLQSGRGSWVAAVYVVAGRMNLKAEDADVVERLMKLPNQKVATLLAALHPARVREMLDAGWPPDDEKLIAQISSQAEQWAKEDGDYQGRDRAAALFAG
jgi:hypothetical protein